MALTLSNIILILTGFQSIIFAIILLAQQGPKKVSNRLLAGFFLVLSLQMAAILAEGFYWPSSNLESWLCLFGFLYGPFIYLYTRSLIFRDFRMSIRQGLHFLPAIGLILLISLGFQFCPTFGFLIYVVLVPYVVASIRSIWGYRSVVSHTQSLSGRIDLSWLQWTILVFSMVLILDILDHVFINQPLLDQLPLVYLALLFLVNGMFFKGFRQPVIFQGIKKADQKWIFLKASDLPLNTGLSEDQEHLLNCLENTLKHDQVFMDPALSLEALAAQLEVAPRKLSELINQHLGQNFMSLINQYRIDLAKEKLHTPEENKYTISEIMYAVGFNSKSSFNTLFKKYTGLTPSEFRKKRPLSK